MTHRGPPLRWVLAAAALAAASCRSPCGPRACRPAAATAPPASALAPRRAEPPPEYVSIAGVSGGDAILHEDLTNQLGCRGVVAGLEGSVLYGVLVDRRDRDRALALLREGARPGRYLVAEDDEGHVWLGSDAAIAGVVRVDGDLGAALAGHPRRAMLERLVASDEYRRHAAGLRLATLALQERPYLTARCTWETGLYVEAEFRHPSRTDAAAKWLFQVWAQGDAVRFGGGSAWNVETEG